MERSRVKPGSIRSSRFTAGLPRIPPSIASITVFHRAYGSRICGSLRRAAAACRFVMACAMTTRAGALTGWRTPGALRLTDRSELYACAPRLRAGACGQWVLIEKIEHAVKADVVKRMRRLCAHNRLRAIRHADTGFPHEFEIVGAVTQRNDL